jgi:hypothetical protein
MRRRTSEARMSSANTINEFITELTRLKNKYISEGKFAEASDIEKRIHEIMSAKYSYIIQGYRHIQYPIVKSHEDKSTLKLEPHKNSDFYIHAYVNTKACWDCPICEERLIQHISVTVNSQTTMPLHIESLVQELAKRAKDHLERHATGEIGDGNNNSSSNDEPEVPGENNSIT